MSSIDNLLTVEECASILKLHRETIKWYIQCGRLKAVKIGYRTTRIRREDLEDFIKSRHGDNYFAEELAKDKRCS
jgi:excisionase family DNA binding protein